MNPVISIIVPVFNTGTFLEKCLDSILAQTISDFEVIIINDGSTDSSGRICDDYAGKDERVQVIHQANGGLSAARNTGLGIAKGKYIGFVDSDDYIEKDMYKKLLSLCESTNSDISICRFSREVKGEVLKEHQDEKVYELDHHNALKQLFKGHLYRFSVCNKLFKKTCFNNISFPEGRIHEDLATTYKLFSVSNKAVYTSYQGYVYVKREASILNSTFKQERLDAFLAWEEILAFMNSRYPRLSNEFLCCFAFGSVDNIYYILNQVENEDDKRKYLIVIRQVVEKYFGKLLLNTSLSFKYKVILALLIFNDYILIFSRKFKK